MWPQSTLFLSCKAELMFNFMPILSPFPPFSIPPFEMCRDRKQLFWAWGIIAFFSCMTVNTKLDHPLKNSNKESVYQHQPWRWSVSKKEKTKKQKGKKNLSLMEESVVGAQQGAFYRPKPRDVQIKSVQEMEKRKAVRRAGFRSPSYRRPSCKIVTLWKRTRKFCFLSLHQSWFGIILALPVWADSLSRWAWGKNRQSGSCKWTPVELRRSLCFFILP